MKWLLTIIVAGFLFEPVYAQNVVGGQIFENKYKNPLPNITIEDLTTHVREVSDADGKFVIRVKTGDVISFSGFGFMPDTIYIYNFKYITVYMQLKQTMLKEVTVLTPEIKTGSLTAPPEKGPFNQQTVLYQTDGNGNYIGGIKLMVHDWKKDENKKKRELQLIADEKTEADILKVFSAQNLQNFLPLRGKELDNFMVLYIPNVKTYTSNSFNLLLYLTSCYKEFTKIPVEKRRSEDFQQLAAKK